MDNLEKIIHTLKVEASNGESRDALYEDLLMIIKSTSLKYNKIIINKSEYRRIKIKEISNVDEGGILSIEENKNLHNLLRIIDDLEKYDFKNLNSIEVKEGLTEIAGIQDLVAKLSNPMYEIIDKASSTFGIVLLLFGILFLFYNDYYLYGIFIEIGGVFMIVISFFFVE